jgi:hypothetical protein
MLIPLRFKVAPKNGLCIVSIRSIEGEDVRWSIPLILSSSLNEPNLSSLCVQGILFPEAKINLLN